MAPTRPLVPGSKHVIGITAASDLRRPVIAAVRHLVTPPAGDRVGICRRWQDVAYRLDVERPWMIVCDARFAPADLDALWEVRRRLPDAVIVAVISPSVESIVAAGRMLRREIDEIVVWEPASPDVRLAEAIDGAVAGRIGTIAGGALGPLVDSRLRGWLGDLIVRCRQPVGRIEAARLYHRDAETLRRHLRASGLAPIDHLITWLRLIHVAYHVAHGHRTVEEVASLLDYPSADALRGKLRRHVNLNSRDLRSGGVEAVLDEFVRRYRLGWWETY